MDYVTLDASSFEYGAVSQLAPLVRRVIACNPSKFTYHGTGTYIVGGSDPGNRVVVIDPGPQLDSHRDALQLALAGSTVSAILVTHCHADHSPLAAWLAAETGAPTIAFGPHADDEWDIGDDPIELDVPDAPDAYASRGADGPAFGAQATDAVAPVVVEESTDRAFTPDVIATTGDAVASGRSGTTTWAMTALHTPGHTSNHLCFCLDDGTTRMLFTGDHVMGWSTTVVSPPDGDMAAYLESLRVVAGRHDDVLVPTHGAPILEPRRFLESLIAHRLDREAQVLAAVRDGLDRIATIVPRLYVDVRLELHKPAGRSVLAHLVKLIDDDLVVASPAGRPRLDSTFTSV
jgi:glyoxylase-like metal-dependent hydrolase (beta-lactamase superfamily II)